MRLINVHTLGLETFVGDNVPKYAILSHTWGADEEELSFDDIQSGNTRKLGIGAEKLRGCCSQAKKDGLNYAWIDTCCINKNSSTELGEAINSMFQWYRKASTCYTFLSDVPSRDDSHDPRSNFFSSRWFRRGWTLQELLAPRKLHFYDQEWASIGTREQYSQEIEQITGISRWFLLGYQDFRQASVAQRMSWAARRETSRKEDLAYCLLGIFDVTMPMVYGENDKAFKRLQQEIMKNTRDDSIFAWGLETAASTLTLSENVFSAGVLAIAPSDFADCGRIILKKSDTVSHSMFDISGGCLQAQLPLYTNQAGQTFCLLSCGPEHEADRVVGIPIYKTIPSAAVPDIYIRRQGRHAALLPRSLLDGPTSPIQIQVDRQNRTPHSARGKRFWLHIEGHQNSNLELLEDNPPLRWQNGRALLVEATRSDDCITQRYLARFRTTAEETQDIITVLDLEIQGSQSKVRCHVMSSPRDTLSSDLFDEFDYIRPEALEKEVASTGKLNIKVHVKELQVAHEPMFVISLAPSSNSMEITIDASSELSCISLKHQFVRMLQERDDLDQEIERLTQQKEETTAALNQMRGEMMANLVNDEASFSARAEKGTRKLYELTQRLHDAMKQQDNQWSREVETLQYLNEPTTRWGPGNWLETYIKSLLHASRVNKFFSAYLPKLGQNNHSTQVQSPLQWASANGYKNIAKLLLEEAANMEASKHKILRTSDGPGILRIFNSQCTHVLSMAFSPHRLQLASGSLDGTIKIWDAATGVCLQTFNSQSSGVVALAFSPNCRLLASGSPYGTSKIWGVATGLSLQTFDGRSSRVTSVAFSPDGGHLVSGSSDGTVKIWDAAKGVCLQAFDGHNGRVSSVAFSPDCQYLASVGSTVKIWRAATGLCLRTFDDPGSVVILVVFSPDGQHLASGSRDGAITVWNISNSSSVQITKGHGILVSSLIFSPDSQQIASGSVAGRISVWDTAGSKLKTVKYQQDWTVDSLVFSPDGQQLTAALSSRNGMIGIWNIAMANHPPLSQKSAPF